MCVWKKPRNNKSVRSFLHCSAQILLLVTWCVLHVGTTTDLGFSTELSVCYGSQMLHRVEYQVLVSTLSSGLRSVLREMRCTTLALLTEFSLRKPGIGVRRVWNAVVRTLHAGKTSSHSDYRQCFLFFFLWLHIELIALHFML